MSSSRVTVARPNCWGARGVTCHVGAEQPDTARDQADPDEPDTAPRVDAVDALIREARRSLAGTGQLSAATADVLGDAVRSLSYAELHDLVVGLDGSDALDALDTKSASGSHPRSKPSAAA